MKSVKAFMILMFISTISMAQVIVTGHIYAEIIEELSVSELSSLNFGKFSISKEGGTITVSPDGERSTTGGVTTAVSTVNQASFSVTGDRNALFYIMLPSSDVVLSNGKSNSLIIRDWIIKNGSDGKSLSSGNEIVYIGATLVVDNRVTTPKGQYYGTYSVKFNYN